MRGLVLLLLLLFGSSRADHFRRNHRRGLLDVIAGDGITSAVPPTSVSDPLAPTSTGPSSDPAPSSTGGVLPALADLLQGSSSTPPPAPSTTGGVLPALSDLLQGSSSTPPPDSSTPAPSTTGSVLPALSDLLQGSSSTPPPAPSTTGGVLPALGDLLQGPSSTLPPDSSTPPPSSTGGVLPALGDLLQGPSSTLPPDSSTPPLSAPPSTTSASGILPILDPIIDHSSDGLTSAIPPTSVLLPAPGSDAPPTPSDSPLPSIIPLPPASTVPPPPASTDSPPSSDPPNALPTIPPPPPSSTPPSPPSTPPPAPSTEPPARPTPSNSVSINSDLSFILTEISLAVASLPTTGGNVLTDPDAATTTVTNTLPPSPSPSSAFASAADPSKDSPAQPPLPSGVPSRIYPATQQVDPHATQDDMHNDGFTLISMLFDKQLNWPFVVGNTIAGSQIIAYVPALISAAIDDPIDQVKTLFLQVFVPLSYTSPSDQLDLGTLWVGYISSKQVDSLEAMIKAKQSKFYTAVPNEAARQLAQRVRTGWPLRGGVNLPDGSSSSGGSSGGPSSGGNGGSGGSSNQQKARKDAIVGVVSSLGAIALLVLVVLIVHSVKRRRELAHRRLADQSSSVGSSGSDHHGPQAVQSGGREFDRDSVGAPRRRSFYFAEDSLRGWEAEREPEREFNEFGGSGTSPVAGMSQRKVGPVVLPGSISAPILRESSMNW